MAIYYGTTKVKPSGFTKAYYGNTLVYQESAPVSNEPLHIYKSDSEAWSASGAIEIYASSALSSTTNIEYSYDKINWTRINYTGWQYIRMDYLTRKNVYIRNTTNTLSTGFSDYFSLSTTHSGIEIEGNLMALLNYDYTITTLPEYCFMYLFQDSVFTDISNIVLPPSTINLSLNCFRLMFNNCKYITSISNLSLPWTTLANECYEQMFYGCIRLTNAGIILPATQGKYYAYQGMFNGCTALTTPPQINLTNVTSANRCCYYMFYNCSSLNISTTQGAAFFTCPSTGYTSDIFNNMFYNTQGGITAPTAGTTYYYS